MNDDVLGKRIEANWKMFLRTADGSVASEIYLELLVLDLIPLVKFLVQRQHIRNYGDYLQEGVTCLIEKIKERREGVTNLKSYFASHVHCSLLRYRYRDKLIRIPETTMRRGIKDIANVSWDDVMVSSRDFDLRADSRALRNELEDAMVTDTNREIKRLLETERSEREIAKILGISRKTVRKYVARVTELFDLYRKT